MILFQMQIRHVILFDPNMQPLQCSVVAQDEVIREGKKSEVLSERSTGFSVLLHKQ